MCHIAQDGQSKLFQWMLRSEDSLKNWDDAIKSRILLSRLVQSTEIINGVKYLVRNFAEMPFLGARSKQFSQHIYRIRVLE